MILGSIIIDSVSLECKMLDLISSTLRLPYSLLDEEAKYINHISFLSLEKVNMKIVSGIMKLYTTQPDEKRACHYVQMLPLWSCSKHSQC